MERQRSIYLKFLLCIVLVVVLVLANRYVFRSSIQDGTYRLINLALGDESPAIKLDANIFGQVADDALKRENESLRKQLGVSPRQNIDIMDARIIYLQRNALVSMAVIDKGSQDGVKQGKAVISGGGILVGSVHAVYDHTSWIVFLDDPRFLASIRFDSSSLLGELKGGNGGNVSINLVSHTENVTEDTLIVTSGLDGFPEGLVAAKIESVKKSSGLFKEIHARTIYSTSDGPLLFVVR